MTRIVPKVRHAAISVMIRPVYLPRYFRIPSDEALLANPSAILQGEVHSPIEINFGSALATEFGLVFAHRARSRINMRKADSASSIALRSSREICTPREARAEIALSAACTRS